MKQIKLQKLLLPENVSQDYQAVWDKFKSMRAVQQLYSMDDNNAISECFRLMVKQAGAKTAPRFNVASFSPLPFYVKGVKTYTNKMNLFKHLRLERQIRNVEYSPVPYLCAAYGVKYTFVAQFSTMRFDLNYLINSAWKDLLFTKEVPLALSRTYPGSKKARHVVAMDKLRQLDYYIAYTDKHTSLGVYRHKEKLILRYDVTPNNVIPMYKNLDAQLKKNWRLCTGALI
jgi:hypothetical protein